MAKDNKKMIRRRLAGAYISSVISISLVLLLVGTATFIFVNAGRVTDFFKENLQMSVIMKTEVSDEQTETFRQGLDTLRFIHSTRLVTVEEGTKELEAMLGEDFLDVFETSPVPSSIDVTLAAAYVSVDSIKMVSSIIAESPLVDDVICRQNLVEALDSNLRKVTLVLVVFIALMLFVSFVQIGNTVRINIFARRFTVHTMKLVGATRAFIIRPFMASSVVQGLISAALASAMIAGGLLYVRHTLPQFSSFMDLPSIVPVFATVFVFALVICVLSTLFTVNKLVSMSKDELYY